MKCLTCRHPWPWAILHGKDVENRTWEPSPAQLRPGDRLAIHGGAIPRPGWARKEAMDDLREIGRRFPALVAPGMKLDEAILPGVVAVVTFGGILEYTTDPWFTGPKGWLLRDVVALPEPVPCGGSQGLWDLPADVLEQVETQLRNRVD